MGRYETIETVIGALEVYSYVRQEMREKYRDENLPPIGKKLHRRIINNACLLAENAERFHLGRDETDRANKYLGVCIDAPKYRLNWKQAERDLDIEGVWKKHNEAFLPRKEELRNLLNRSKEIVSEEERQKIREEYRLEKNWSKAVTDHWHCVITGRAVKLAMAVVKNGGTEEEIKQAMEYLIVCMDVNKYLLDYKRFKQERGIVELSEKYGIKVD